MPKHVWTGAFLEGLTPKKISKAQYKDNMNVPDITLNDYPLSVF